VDAVNATPDSLHTDGWMDEWMDGWMNERGEGDDKRKSGDRRDRKKIEEKGKWRNDYLT